MLAKAWVQSAQMLNANRIREQALLPQLIFTERRFVPATNPVGAKLARESMGSVSTDAECHGAFASKLCSYRGAATRSALTDPARD